MTELTSELDDWSSDGAKLEKTFTFTGFTGAVAFVNRVADAANAADHHPDIHIEDYKNVRIVLTTHASGGISRSDVDLATTIDGLVEGTAR
ncbi:MAG: 4a-hydroxytetrahydrobiopterin dehydratase [Chloroflexota bacterium]|nr:4a-hydroxytetrahydrobiopterin dehydratase [Chloroflexota bacterium]MDE3102594.1 4a-hydroxytetrahydrobiopterin dehydratase [Chloroflexota bacterium]